MAVLAQAQITLSAVVDIQAVYKYYKLQSSTSTKPSKPTSINTLPPSGWSATEPAYTSGSTNTLYTVELTVFTDGSFSYSEVMTDSSYEAAKAAYNKAVAAGEAASAAQSNAEQLAEVIIGTQTATTAAWTGTSSKLASVKDGTMIQYWLPRTSAANVTLKLTLADGSTHGPKNVYYGGTSRLGTHYPAGNIIRLVYRENVSINGSTTLYTGWWCDSNYDSNTYDRLRYNQAIKAGSAAIVAKNIIVGSAETSGAYIHLKSGSTFDITYPILYASDAIAANGTGTANYLAIPFDVATTQSMTLTAYRAVYIKGILSGSGFTPVSTTPLTQDIPEEEDGYQYILLGTAYSTTAIYLISEHPIYQYHNGGFKSTIQIAAEAQITASGAMDQIDSNKKQTDDLVSRLADIERTLDAITLRVATIANSKAFRAGADVSSYVTEAVPTLMNYPTFTDFFIWKACATNIYCSDALICGTNNYAAHENAVAHCTADDTYYIFEKDNAGEYGWRAMTHDEYMEKSNKYSLINIEDDQIIISSALNNALTNLLINSTGVSVTAGKLFCC